MTIIDRINLHRPLIAAENINALLLGRLECKALIAAFELIYQQQLTTQDLHLQTFMYGNLQIIPADCPSMFALARIITQEEDESIRV